MITIAESISSLRVRWLRRSGGRWALVLTLALLLSSAAVAAARPEPPIMRGPAAVTPSNEWVNLYSSRSYLHGELAPAGAVVRAYDRSGVQAGEFTVTQAGWYGIMPVYRDDPTTPEDEGLLPGEEVRFTINGVAARAAGPDSPIWTSNGELKHVDLVANSIIPTNEWVGFYSLNSTLDGLALPVGSVVRAFNPRGVLAGEFIVEHVGWYGVMAVYRDDPATTQDEGLRPGETVAFTVAGQAATVLGPDTAVWGANGELKQVDLAATIAAPAVSVGREGSAVVVGWQHRASDVKYEVWRATTPYFTPGVTGTTRLAEVTPPGPYRYSDDGALGTPGARYFYLVRAYTVLGEWVNSARVGGFSFALPPAN